MSIRLYVKVTVSFLFSLQPYRYSNILNLQFIASIDSNTMQSLQIRGNCWLLTDIRDYILQKVINMLLRGFYTISKRFRSKKWKKKKRLCFFLCIFRFLVMLFEFSSRRAFFIRGTIFWNTLAPWAILPERFCLNMAILTSYRVNRYLSPISTIICTRYQVLFNLYLL